ncbi:MAG TPA: type 1 glutamine amidotransferase domain-containing protein [Polyangia bacterium]|nr:type 1 glutamine amidotransferase domain-containing protein [Polyangia bacterium]
MSRVAFVVDEMFEDAELRVPYDRIRQAGHEVVLVGREAGKRLEGEKKKEHVETEAAIADVEPEDFDALVIPGGYSPDHLRVDAQVVDFVRDLVDGGKPVAAVCHAGSLLVEANVVSNRTVTSWPSIRTDLINAGAHWVDRAVVEDGNLITSRRPDDLSVFSDAILRQLEGRIPPRVQPSKPAEGDGENIDFDADVPIH